MECYCGKLAKEGCKFCSRSCGVSFNNRGVCRVIRKHLVRFCVLCGKKNGRGGSSKYCSHKCARQFEWESKVRSIESTGVILNVQNAKRYLAEKRGKRCEVCGVRDWMGLPLVLILDHMDGNSSNFGVGNLRLLCANCDSQTPTFKNRNKGKGRFKRMQRYREGKSY